jgi:hypothetical protein
VTHRSVSEFRNQELLRFYNRELTLLCWDLLWERYIPLFNFYGKLFDELPNCVNLINMPAQYTGRVLPTAYMVHREARFALYSDRPESDELDRVWSQIHPFIDDKVNPSLLIAMSTQHTLSRWRILNCKSMIMNKMLIVVELLEQNHYVRAIREADLMLKDVRVTFDEVVAPYLKSTLQPR